MNKPDRDNETRVQNEDLQAETDRIEGRNAIIEALRSGLPIDKVYIARGSRDEDKNSSLSFIASKARAAGAVVVEVDKRKLDYMSVTHAHQGVIAQIPAVIYAEISDMLDLAAKKGENPVIIVCDEISDPHNLGAIIRTAEASGAHGIVIPKRRGVSLTATVAKASAGAVFHMHVARVANISQSLAALKKQRLWIYGTAADAGKSLWEADFSGGTVIVVGSEGEGLGRLVKESCDELIKIPMAGKTDSLNASVSAAVVLYEIVRQRNTAVN